jgi:sec-independent protein translocase protein TatB
VFDIGFWEIMFIVLLALLVLGPEKMPRIVSTLGNWAGRARYMARSLRMQVEQELAREVAAKEKTREAAGPGSRDEGDEPGGKV